MHAVRQAKRELVAILRREKILRGRGHHLPRHRAILHSYREIRCMENHRVLQAGDGLLSGRVGYADGGSAGILKRRGQTRNAKRKAKYRRIKVSHRLKYTSIEPYLSANGSRKKESE